jgi:hypothetical protein
MRFAFPPYELSPGGGGEGERVRISRGEEGLHRIVVVGGVRR